MSHPFPPLPTWRLVDGRPTLPPGALEEALAVRDADGNIIPWDELEDEL